jgi:hypothetical protein
MDETGLEEVVFFDSEPVVAWRVWLVATDDGEPQSLRSISYRIRWPKRKPMRAHCLFTLRHPVKGPTGPLTPPQPHPGEQCPVLSHQCGIYALKEPDDLPKWAPTFSAWAPGMPRVIGQVALWGRVLEHELGYRAEYAYPVSFVQPEDTDLGDWLEQEYL